MKTAFYLLIDRIEKDTAQYYSCDELLEMLKDYESINDEHLKSAYLHGKINARTYDVGSELNLGSDEYFAKEWNNK